MTRRSERNIGLQFLNGVGCSSLAISSSCSARNIQLAARPSPIVSAQTLNCLEHCEQAKPTSWHMPYSTPGRHNLTKFHLTEFKAFLELFPLFDRSILCCPWSCLILFK